MKRAPKVALITGFLCLASGCKDYLDVNTNPNAPETVAANLYLAPMIHWMITAPQYDGRFVGRYTQEWKDVSAGSPGRTWDRMGYDPSSDNGAEQWRDVYWSLGQNLIDMIAKAEAEQRWDIAGVGYIMKAWGWQALTDLHGEIIVKEAIDPTRFSFDYDGQDVAYAEVQRLLGLAITDLQRSDGLVSQTYLARTDHLYNGDRTKWLKLAYGLLALNLNHFTNKSTYKPADVIAAVDKSFAGNADDALFPYPCVDPGFADCNFNGPTRGNLISSLTLNARQTTFAVALMDGTDFGVVDPRLTRMLAPAADGVYRGTDINQVGFGALPAAQQPYNLYGLPGRTVSGGSGRYIFTDHSKFPFVTYAQLQFVKAEAAFLMGDKATALAAYRSAVSAHLDFVNARNLDDNQAVTQISSTEKAAFLGDIRIVPIDPAQLTLTQIMTQKYIAQYGWGHNEMWMDMRRYHYTDIDAATGKQIYPGFAAPTNLYPDNSNKIVQRIRPRYNSEYVWNVPALQSVGGLALDYHTKPLWITQP
jgi:hypothetical protein